MVANENGLAPFLRNGIGSQLHWIEVRLEGITVNRNGIGSKVGMLPNLFLEPRPHRRQVSQQ